MGLKDVGFLRMPFYLNHSSLHKPVLQVTGDTTGLRNSTQHFNLSREKWRCIKAKIQREVQKLLRPRQGRCNRWRGEKI
jgi:hypothetical protein